MGYGHFLTFLLPFIFWAVSFVGSSSTSYLYIGMLAIFGGMFGFYVVAQTIIFQFQGIKGYTSENGLDKVEIWGVFGVYAAVQLIMAFLGQHYFIDSIMYLLSAEIKDWCEAHPGVCEDYSVLDMN